MFGNHETPIRLRQGDRSSGSLSAVSVHGQGRYPSTAICRCLAISPTKVGRTRERKEDQWIPADLTLLCELQLPSPTLPGPPYDSTFPNTPPHHHSCALVGICMSVTTETPPQQGAHKGCFKPNTAVFRARPMTFDWKVRAKTWE